MTDKELIKQEIERWIKEKHFIFTEIDEIIETAHHFVEWQRKKDQETIELAEDHAMLAGMEKMKEEMMKDAVETTVHNCQVDGIMINGIEIFSDGLTLDEQIYKDGDKVKIIICKPE